MYERRNILLHVPVKIVGHENTRHVMAELRTLTLYSLTKTYEVIDNCNYRIFKTNVIILQI